jgi:hypothetical protein
MGLNRAFALIQSTQARFWFEWGRIMLCMSPGALAQTAELPDAWQSKVLALENAWNPEEIKDVRALDLLLDSKAVYIDAEGSLMNKVQFMASVKKTRHCIRNRT